jgi:hypothetical protein
MDSAADAVDVAYDELCDKEDRDREEGNNTPMKVALYLFSPPLSLPLSLSLSLSLSYYLIYEQLKMLRSYRVKYAHLYVFQSISFGSDGRCRIVAILHYCCHISCEVVVTQPFLRFHVSAFVSATCCGLWYQLNVVRYNSLLGTSCTTASCYPNSATFCVCVCVCVLLSFIHFRHSSYTTPYQETLILTECMLKRFVSEIEKQCIFTSLY